MSEYWLNVSLAACWAVCVLGVLGVLASGPLADIGPEKFKRFVPLLLLVSIVGLVMCGAYLKTVLS